MSEPTKVQRAHGAIRDMVKWAHDVEARSQIAHAAVDEAVRHVAEQMHSIDCSCREYEPPTDTMAARKPRIDPECLALRKKVTDG
jgi:hypothetical protein